ncbi:hypothetical protein KQI63_11075 [bacterium]|nr:hypothetical protein [bacterium]
MKRNILPFAIFLSLLMLFAISCDNGENPEESIENPLSSLEEGGEANPDDSEIPVMINPNRPYYDVVVVDIDLWEICLNLNRARYHCNSYTGHLWYQVGSFVFEGTATAVYNHALDQLTVTALDSGWDRGHIMYGLQFTEGTNDMYGSFCYYEFPRRTNGINAWLAQGTLGPHTFNGTEEAAKRPVGPVAMEHPKKARYFSELSE